MVTCILSGTCAGAAFGIQKGVGHLIELKSPLGDALRNMQKLRKQSKSTYYSEMKGQPHKMIGPLSESEEQAWRDAHQRLEGDLDFFNFLTYE